MVTGSRTRFDVATKVRRKALLVKYLEGDDSTGCGQLNHPMDASTSPIDTTMRTALSVSVTASAPTSLGVSNAPLLPSFSNVCGYVQPQRKLLSKERSASRYLAQPPECVVYSDRSVPITLGKPTASPVGPYRSSSSCAPESRSPTRSTRPTGAASSTATSSPPTSC